MNWDLFWNVDISLQNYCLQVCWGWGIIDQLKQSSSALSISFKRRNEKFPLRFFFPTCNKEIPACFQVNKTQPWQLLCRSNLSGWTQFENGSAELEKYNLCMLVDFKLDIDSYSLTTSGNHSNWILTVYPYICWRISYAHFQMWAQI